MRLVWSIKSSYTCLYTQHITDRCADGSSSKIYKSRTGTGRDAFALFLLTYYSLAVSKLQCIESTSASQTSRNKASLRLFHIFSQSHHRSTYTLCLVCGLYLDCVYDICYKYYPPKESISLNRLISLLIFNTLDWHFRHRHQMKSSTCTWFYSLIAINQWSMC